MNEFHMVQSKIEAYDINARILIDDARHYKYIVIYRFNGIIIKKAFDLEENDLKG